MFNWSESKIRCLFLLKCKLVVTQHVLYTRIQFVQDNQLKYDDLQRTISVPLIAGPPWTHGSRGREGRYGIQRRRGMNYETLNPEMVKLNVMNFLNINQQIGKTASEI